MAFATRSLYRPIAGATVGVWGVDVPGAPMVLKLIHHGESGDPRWPTSADPRSSYHWRREAELLAPGSALRRALAEVPDGISPVACRGVFGRPDGSVALWLPRLTGRPGQDWTPERYRLAARQLGRTQAALAGSPVLADPALTTRWLRDYTELHRPRGTGDPVGRWESALELGLFGDRDPDRTAAWAASLDARLDRVEELPRTLTHFDFHPGNLFDADGETVVIDWAYAGVGPVGLDAACLAFEAVYDFHCGAAELPGLYRLVADGYVEGWLEVGGPLDARAVRAAMAETVAVKLGWTIAATVTAVADRVPTLNDRPLAEGARAWAGAGRFLLDLIDEISEVTDVDGAGAAPTSPANGPTRGPTTSEERIP